jgi:hypothetical protein
MLGLSIARAYCPEKMVEEKPNNSNNADESYPDVMAL